MNYQDILQEIIGDPLIGLIDGELGARIRRASEPCSDVLDRILENLSGRGADALRDSAKDVCGSIDPRGSMDPCGRRTGINTFPFGRKTGNTYPNYIGIAVGPTSLQKALDSAENQCRCMECYLNASQDKTVLILTDKWDQPRFKRDYEQIFLRYALWDRVLFMFVLVTDYGTSEIPFLPWDRAKLDLFADRYRHAGGPEDQLPLDSLLGNRMCTYDVSVRKRGGYIDTSYQFDFVNRTYELTQTSEQSDMQQSQSIRTHRSGPIKTADLLKFASEAYGSSKLPGDDYTEDPECVDDGNSRTQHSLSIFGKTLRWGPGLGEFEEIKNAVDELVKSLS